MVELGTNLNHAQGITLNSLQIGLSGEKLGLFNNEERAQCSHPTRYKECAKQVRLIARSALWMNTENVLKIRAPVQLLQAHFTW